MQAIECKYCKSVMGLAKETPRWALYKCFSCRQVIGQIDKKLTGQAFEDATREMDDYALYLMGDETRDIGNRLESMTSEEIDIFFSCNDKQFKLANLPETKHFQDDRQLFSLDPRRWWKTIQEWLRDRRR